MRLSKILLVLGLVLLTVNLARAYDFIEDGLAFSFIADEPDAVAVVRGAEGEHVVVPSTVNHEGTTYRVVEIADLAFLNFDKMKSLEIQEGVSVIGENAFMYCNSLTDISFPKSLKMIKTDAFLYAWHIQNVHIADVDAWCGVQFLDFPFKSEYSYRHDIYLGDRLLTDVTLNAESISSSCFRGVESIEKVTFTGNLTVIPAYAFRDCTSLKTVNLPETLTSIETNAFRNCSSLGAVSFPPSLTAIGSYAFSGCVAMDKLNLPDSLEKIEGHTFENCTALTELYVPTGMKHVDKNAFQNDNSITKIIYNAVDAQYITGISNLKQSVESVVFGDRVSVIPSKLFTGFTKIKKIIIPGNVASIGEQTFASCTNLAEVTLNEGLKKISSKCFFECTSLKEIIIPSTVTEIQSYAFRDCSSLSRVALPDKLEEIQNGCFYDCTSLDNVVIPSSVTTIWNSAFLRCANLSNLTMSPNIERICGEAFRGCAKLEKVNLPETLKEINARAFAECAFLEFEFPKNVATVGDGILNGCSGLKTIEYNVEKLKFTNSVFNGNLEKLIIGNEVVNIGNSVFRNCQSIDVIEVNAATPPAITDLTFNSDTYDISVLKVPYGCKENYRNCDVWKNFMHIEEQLSSLVDDLEEATGMVVYLNGCRLTLDTSGTAIPVYDVNGMLKTTLSEGESRTLAPGIYFLHTEHKTYKIRID